MIDTPPVPSEATTGTPPAPETPALTAASNEAGNPAEATDAAAAPAAQDPSPQDAAEADAAAPGDSTVDASTDDDSAADHSAADDSAAAAADPSASAPAHTPPARPELTPAACAQLLATHFPALFGGSAKPLKLRIQADIQARAPGVFTRKALSVFLHRHTTSNAYLNALVKAPQRVDLDGADAGEIAPEHRAAATEELARRRAVHEQRRREARAAEQAARAGQADLAGPAPRSAAEPDPRGAPRPGPRPDRPARADGAGRSERRPGHHPERRAERHDERPAAGDTVRPARPERRTGEAHGAAASAPPAEAFKSEAAAPQPVWTEAERERAALLRAYEGSTLTRANFCVLKRIDEATLEAQLQLARQERAQRPAAPPRPEPRADARPDPRSDTRFGGRPGRGDDGPRPRRPRPATPGR